MAYYIFPDIHIHNTSQLQLEMEKQGMATGSKQSSTLANWRNCHPVLQLRCPKKDKKPWTFLWTSCRKQEILLKFATSDSKGCIILSWNKGVDTRWSTSSRNGIIRSKGKLFELMWFILDRFYIKYQFAPTGPIEKTWGPFVTETRNLGYMDARTFTTWKVMQHEKMNIHSLFAQQAKYALVPSVSHCKELLHILNNALIIWICKPHLSEASAWVRKKKKERNFRFQLWHWHWCHRQWTNILDIFTWLGLNNDLKLRVFPPVYLKKKKTLNSGKKKSILQTELAYFTEGDIFPFLVNKHRKKTISLYLLRGINISPLCFNATIIRELTHSSVLMLKHIQYICHAINPP